MLGVLHPGGQGRPDVDLRAGQVRGAPLQVRLGHRLELQRHSRPAGEALGRRHVVGPHVASSRCSTAPPARPRAAARRAAPPRWCASTWTTPRSPTSSTGRCARRRRRTRSSPPATARDFNGDAYHTISGQNSNNSVRVTDEFMRAVEAGGKWQTRFRTTGEVCETLEAKDLWRQVAEAAWGCADPGVQYDSTINRWHTCPNTGRINASNPCSEYMFLDDTACNLASVNLTKFLARRRLVRRRRLPPRVPRVLRRAGDPRRPLELPDGEHRARTATTTGRSASATRTSAACSCRSACRTTADEGRAIAACAHGDHVRARVHDERRDGRPPRAPSPGFAKNREPMLRVMRMHRDAAYAIDRDASCSRRGRRRRSTLPRGVRRLGRGRPPRRDARLPQRAGHRARAHGHHRPAHGLRHDGHRARLRAREVQEARRRRLLQDRQPDGAARRSAASATASARCRRSSRTSRARNTLLAAPHINRRTLQARRA